MIKSIFYCEFDPTTGPVMLYQDPLIISKEVFDNYHYYFITKPQLHGLTISIHIDGNVVIGYPIYIEDIKYPRNMFMFNICFVINNNINPAHIEHITQKINLYARDLEERFGVLSDICKRTEFLNILKIIRETLNEKGTFISHFYNRILDLKIYNFEKHLQNSRHQYLYLFK